MLLAELFGSNGSAYASIITGLLSLSLLIAAFHNWFYIFRLVYCITLSSAIFATNPAKSIGVNSTPYSGLPRKPICSHLIIPSVLFFRIMTLIGRLYCACSSKFCHKHHKTAISYKRYTLSFRLDL